PADLHVHLLALISPLFTNSSFFFLLPQPPTSTLFPYTTLFRSGSFLVHLADPPLLRSGRHSPLRAQAGPPGHRDRRVGAPFPSRSEEHTSELQSPCNLVCRLLLEKKKINRHVLQLTATSPSCR